MAATKSAISFGMIYIPITLQKTNRDTSISFNQLSKETNERIKYVKTCPSCTKELKNEDIIKGFEVEKGRYVTFEKDELERIKSKKDKTIHILHFAKMSDINQIYFEKDYYAVPQAGGEKAFELFRQAMYTKKVIAIAKTVMGTKEELVALYPTKEGIVTKILFYQEEINPYPTYNKVTVEKPELQMAKSLIDNMMETFDASKYRDEYQQKLREAIQAKIEGQGIINVDTEQPQTAINLMDALAQTLAMSENNPSTANPS